MTPTIEALPSRFQSSLAERRRELGYSTGHAALDHETHDDLQQLLARADRDMYAARARAPARGGIAGT